LALGLSACRPDDAQSPTVSASGISPTASPIDLPEFNPQQPQEVVSRRANPQTIFPDRPRVDVILYSVQPGDSVFSIAQKFNLEPETILWGNAQVLEDDPHQLRPGQELNVLPIDGVYYQWQQGDSLEGVADAFETSADAILDWPGNDFDVIEQSIDPGTWVIVPGGKRAFQQWFVPTIARGSAGVGAAYGPGGCSGDYSGGAVGSGGFIWPVAGRFISGNDYWSGHLAIDIGVVLGESVWAADSGVVVFSGWAYGGYGNMVMLDHGNGWQTLYAHLSQVFVSCGQSVAQGSTIGAGGSTGNSTGAHLHFETRYLDGFVNPWYVLP